MQTECRFYHPRSSLDVQLSLSRIAVVPTLKGAPDIIIASNNPPDRWASCVFGAINQAEFGSAIAGGKRASGDRIWDDKVGVFRPNSPMASDVGLQVLASKRDYAKVKRDLAAAGYQGECILHVGRCSLSPTNRT